MWDTNLILYLCMINNITSCTMKTIISNTRNFTDIQNVITVKYNVIPSTSCGMIFSTSVRAKSAHK